MKKLEKASIIGASCVGLSIIVIPLFRPSHANFCVILAIGFVLIVTLLLVAQFCGRRKGQKEN